MHPARLFRGLIEQLDHVVTEPNELQLVLCAPHLRVLILDGNPLYNQVRRERRARGLPDLVPHFEVLTNPAYERQVMADQPIFWSRGDALSPRLGTGLPGQIERLNTGQFLKHRVLYVEGRNISVREVIRQVGYVGGVLHAGSPNSEVEQLLADWDGSTYIGNVSAVLHCVRAITDVVAHGLRPLIIE